MKKLLVSIMMLFAAGCCAKAPLGAGAGAGGEGLPPAEAEGPLKDIHFAFDSAALDGQAKDLLRRNADWMKANAAQHVTIEGHCDERGTNEYNMALGQRRASSAFNFLRSLGIPTKQMSTISYGKELPLDPGHNEEAWAKNRRAHFSLK